MPLYIVKAVDERGVVAYGLLRDPDAVSLASYQGKKQVTAAMLAQIAPLAQQADDAVAQFKALIQTALP